MSLGLSPEERERLIYFKNNCDYIDFHHIPLWLENDSDMSLVQLVNTILILLRLDMIDLIKKQRDDYIMDAVFGRLAFYNEYNVCGFKFLRFKWSIESNIRDHRILTNILDEVLKEQWLDAFGAKTDCVQANISKQDYIKYIYDLRHNKFCFHIQDKNRIYDPYLMFYSLHSCEHTTDENCPDAYNDYEYQRCKSNMPDFIVISRLFFDANFKFEKLVQ
jgi:hypothetical protein